MRIAWSKKSAAGVAAENAGAEPNVSRGWSGELAKSARSFFGVRQMIYIPRGCGEKFGRFMLLRRGGGDLFRRCVLSGAEKGALNYKFLSGEKCGGGRRVRECHQIYCILSSFSSSESLKSTRIKVRVRGCYNKIPFL